MKVSDIRINSLVKSVLTKHWVDVHKIKLDYFGGTIRLSGEICPIGTGARRRLDPYTVELIESEIRRVPGVKRVYLNFTNWHR
jgi:hypothetical protein